MNGINALSRYHRLVWLQLYIKTASKPDKPNNFEINTDDFVHLQFKTLHVSCETTQRIDKCVRIALSESTLKVLPR